MKLFYRIFIFLLIAAGALFFVWFPLNPSMETLLSELESPIRQQVPVHDGGMARLQLSENEALLYDAFCEAAEARQPEMRLPVGAYPNRSVENAVYAVLIDKPQYFFIDFSELSISLLAEETIIQIRYLAPDEIAQKQEKLDKEIVKILDQMAASGAASDYDKTLFLHDFLIENCTYDSGNQSPDNHNAYGAIVDQFAVCDGYAHAMQLLLTKAEVNSLYLFGTAQTGNGAESHGWNLVRIDGGYTHVDATWDDMGSQMFEEVNLDGNIASHTFFGVSDEQIASTHLLDTAYPFAPPPAVDRNWFSHKKLSAPAADLIAEAAAQILLQNAERTTPHVEIRLTDRAAFHTFLEDYESGAALIIEEANEMLREKGSPERFRGETKSFVTDAEHGCLLMLISPPVDPDAEDQTEGA